VTSFTAATLNSRVNVRRDFAISDLLDKSLHPYLAVHQSWGTSVILRDYLENLIEALEDFRMPTQPGVGIECDELVIDRINGMRPYRDEFIEFCLVYSTQFDTDDAYLEVHLFLERLLQLQHPTYVTGPYYEWYFDAFRFAAYEWVLYLIATLIRSRRFKTVTRFMNDTYLYHRTQGPEMLKGSISDFNDYVQSIDEYRKNRLKMSRYSIVADMIKEMATHKRIPFTALFQADLLLMLRPVILNPATGPSWNPRLYGYSQLGGPLDVFARANTPTGQSAIRELFGVRDAKELAQRIGLAFKNQSLTRFLQDRSFRLGVNIGDLLNWDELKSLVNNGT
jgi:hypothetical protein